MVQSFSRKPAFTFNSGFKGKWEDIFQDQEDKYPKSCLGIV
jgi:hypothetical protein